MTKPLPALGLVIGVIATYVAVGASSYATTRLTRRLQMFRDDPGQTLPWLALLVVIAVVLGLLMMAPAIGAGVTTGSGLLLTAVGLAAMLLPVRQTIDLMKLFEFPGSRYGSSYLLFDGSVILFGIPLLLVGIRRWTQESKLARTPMPPGLAQGSSGYQSTYPQTQQWGGYPGQQPYQPPQPYRQPQDQPQSQPQNQPPQYPGQQQ
ncbi:hypothetical protein EV137_5730 [Kribbella pratensis]|jgi:uncharacterized membrane protein YidH (DUF202 family)|uniref:Uncharacterized protein n=1 Tax=Kribbella pratensis TaxID=2512112 RepID=A0ABY2FAM3_9ACTN|nr:hypothetical protein [Kribbella pratensis]TDW87647.1 hypothetical protein EV137_5730 [Kribbella pratensis]